MINIHVVNIEGKGRGIVAAQDIDRGECIDCSPTLSFTNFADVGKTVFRDYYFCPRSEVAENTGVFILGLASLCNHAKNPNAEIVFDNSNIGIVSRLMALRNISNGEEITIDYGNVWFEVVD